MKRFNGHKKRYEHNHIVMRNRAKFEIGGHLPSLASFCVVV